MQTVQKTITRKEGLPAQAITLLVSLFFALGIAPGFAVQQAWADEDITVALAAGTHQGAGKTSYEVTEADRSATLYAQVQDFKLGSDSLMTGGYDAYYGSYGAGFTSEDCANFTVTWYEGSVAEANALKTEALAWNDIMDKPKWSTDFSCTPQSIYDAADGTYKYYAVATVAKQGYTTTSSEPLEFTITVNRGGASQPAAEYAIAVEAAPTDGGTVKKIANNVTGDELAAAAEKTSVAVDIVPAEGRSIESVKVLNEAGQDVSSAVSLYDNTNSYYGSGSEYVFTMPAYAVKVAVTFSSGAVKQKKEITFEVRDSENTLLWEGDDYSIEVKDSEGNAIDSMGGWDTNKFELAIGETYAYTIKGVTDGKYKEITDTYTVSDEYSIVKLTLEAAEQPVANPTLTLVVEPAEAASLVQLWDGNDQIALAGGKANVAAGKEIEVAFQTYGTDYEPDTVNVTGATINTYGGTGYYFDMPATDTTVTVTLKSTAPEPAKTKVAAPKAVAGLVYTGSEQTGVAEGEGYTLSGDAKATNAGDYTATATLAEGYVWADESTEAKTITWSIAKKEIAVPAAVTGLVANGQEQTGVADGEGYMLSGNKAVDAGDYTAKAIADANHKFAGDKDSVEIAWSIAKASSTEPTQPGTTGGNSGNAGNTGAAAGSNAGTTGATTGGTSATAGAGNGSTQLVAGTVAGASKPASSQSATSKPSVKKTTPAKNSAKVSKTKITKKLKAKSLKKKAATIALPKVKTTHGKAKWKVYAKDKKKVLTLKNGKIKVKKGAKKGTYTIKVRAYVAKTAKYKAAKTKVVTIKVRVK